MKCFLQLQCRCLLPVYAMHVPGMQSLQSGQRGPACVQVPSCLRVEGQQSDGNQQTTLQYVQCFIPIFPGCFCLGLAMNTSCMLLLFFAFLKYLKQQKYSKFTVCIYIPCSGKFL